MTDKLEQLLTHFETAKNYYGDEYNRGKEDVAFVLGDQWPETVKSNRQKEGRPCLVENHLLPFVNNVVNDIRQIQPSIIVKPADSDADVDTAEVMRGIIRNIEYVSKADTAYDKAAFNAISSGYGFIRVKTEYANPMSFDQEIRIERITNPFSVLMDPSHERLDGADSNYCFVFDDMDVADFEAEYPEADVEDFPTPYAGEWRTENTIRVAEYYYREFEEKTLYRYEVMTPMGPAVRTGLEVPEGAVVLDERSTEIPTVKWCKATAKEILEEGEIPSVYIPIVPVVGFETWYEDKRQSFSLIHQAKDAQRMFNYWKTASTEIIALQPKAPYIGAKGQFKSNSRKWAQANVVNYPFLEYDPVTVDGQLAPAPQRVAPPTSSGSMMQEAAAAANGIQASLGMYDAKMGQNTSDVSGKAIIARQMQGDNVNYHFVDNLATAMQQVGCILVDMIPSIYSGARVVRIMGEDNVDEMMPVNQAAVRDGKDGYRPAKEGEIAERVHNLNVGKYDVVVEVGPSYATKRQEAANAILEIGRVNSDIYTVAGDLLIENLDVPNAKVIADRIRTTMDPSLFGDDLEAQRLQAAQQTLAQMQERLEQTQAALLAKTQNQEFENQLEAQKVEIQRKELEVKALKTMAEVEKLQAEANQKIPAEAANETSEAISRLEGQVQDVMGAMEEFLSAEERRASSEA